MWGWRRSTLAARCSERPVAARAASRGHRAGPASRDRQGRGVPRAHVRGRVPGVQGAGAPVDLTTEAAFGVEQFRDFLALEAGDSAHTVANYVRDVRRLAGYAGTKGARRPEDVTSGLLREFVYELKDLGLAAATIRRQISAVRTYYRYLVGEGHTTRDPSERLESPRQWRRLPTVLSVAEIERLLAAPNADEPLAIRDGALLEFAYATGARVSELVGLKLQDVLYEDGLARIFGKGSKERIVPVGRRALGAVALYAREIRPGLVQGQARG